MSTSLVINNNKTNKPCLGHPTKAIAKVVRLFDISLLIDIESRSSKSIISQKLNLF